MAFGGAVLYTNAEEKKCLESNGTAKLAKEEKSGLRVYKVGIA